MNVLGAHRLEENKKKQETLLRNGGKNECYYRGLSMNANATYSPAGQLIPTSLSGLAL